MTLAVQELPQTLDRERQSSREDWEALRRAADGDADAFTAIVERHQDRLQRLCERFLADSEEARDATQEVFIKAYRKAGSTQPRGQLYTWLYRVAVNHCLNVLRRRKIVRFLRFQSDPRSPAWDVPDTHPGAEREIEGRRRWRLMRRWLDELPTGQRAVLVLARFEGLSYKEIAAQLGITLGAVESRLFRAMRTLERKRAEAALDGNQSREELQ